MSSIPKFYARVLVQSTTTGTGTLTLGSTVAGYQAWSVLGDGNSAYYYIEAVDANGVPTGDYEEGIGTYTSSGTTLSRDLVIESSNSNALVSFSSGTKRVAITVAARLFQNLQDSLQTYICGLLVTYNSTTSINVSAGSCWDPSSNKLITYAGGNTSPSLSASTFYAVYIYDSAGTPTIDVQAEDPPSTAYAGTARKRGSGNGGRYIGSFLTDGSSHIYQQVASEWGMNSVDVQYETDNSASPFAVLGAGSSTTYVAVSLAGCIPRYVSPEMFVEIFVSFLTTAAATSIISLSLDGTNEQGGYSGYVSAVFRFPKVSIWHPIAPSTPNINYKVAQSGSGVDPIGYLQVAGYRLTR